MSDEIHDLINTYWDAIDKQLEQLSTAKSADDVVRILEVEDHNSPAFFGGGGGDEDVEGALLAAGWTTIWAEASYHFAMRAPDGSIITYVEGDIYPENRRPLPHNEEETP